MWQGESPRDELFVQCTVFGWGAPRAFAQRLPLFLAAVGSGSNLLSHVGTTGAVAFSSPLGTAPGGPRNVVP